MSAQRLLALGLALVATTATANPSGKKWGATPVNFKVFTHSSINGVGNFSTTVLPAVNAGFRHWTSLEVSCTGWASQNVGSFSSPNNLSAINGSDQENRVIWLGGSQWVHGQLTLGVTTTTFYTGSGEIFDADMELNNDRTWKVGTTSYNSDVESIVTHEAGHFLGLDHSSPTSAVMYATYNTGELKTQLTSYDQTDVCTVYPGSGASGAQGSFCQQNSNCGTTAPACRGAAGTSTSKICTKECTGDSQCPSGYTCQSSSPAGSTGRACLLPVGAPDLCKFCTSGSNCGSGNCVTDGQRNWCTRTCSTAADCGSGYDCVEGTTSRVCVPANNVCPSPQCTSSSQCAVGYACTGGMCTATGNPGDRCEVSVFCKDCSMCVGSYQEAYCYACCGGQSGTGGCQGCASSSCATGTSCTQLTNNQDSVCVPQGGTGACQACDSQTPCNSGLTCVYAPGQTSGRCHNQCNLQSPGSCNACFDPGNGQGACACPDEVAQIGQSCGNTTGTIRVCTNGAACVGSPKTCRSRCTAGNAASCPGGETCQLVDGVAVCLPTNAPGSRCSPCANGACAAGLACVFGRCYELCNTAAPACSSCVDPGSGEGVCACGDQLAAPNEFCGVLPANGVIDFYACQMGASCVENLCRAQCDPASPVCSDGERCVVLGGSGVCLAAGSYDAGTPDGGGLVHPDAGTPTSANAVCGCGAGGPGASGLALAVALLLRRVRRGRAR